MDTWQSFALSVVMAIFIVTAYMLVCRCREYKENIENYTNQEPMILELHAMLSAVDPKAANKISVTSDTSSYTLNKEKMHLCVKDTKGRYFNKNMLFYVALHELAHVICDEIGHTEKFNRIFDSLLERAVDIGLYRPDIPPSLNYVDECGGES